MSIAVDLPTPANLNRIAAIFHRDRRLAVSYGANFYLSWINIIVEVTIAYYLSILLHPSSKFGWHGHVGSYFAYLVINFTILRFETTSLTAFSEVIRDGQTAGTLEVVLATPTSLPLLVLSSGLWAFLLTALQTAAYIVIALCFHLDLSHTNILTALVFFALTILSLSPVGVAAAATTMIFKKTGPVEWAMTSVSQLFSGVYLPVALLPHSLQLFSWLLPLTHVINGMQGAIFGASVLDLGPDALWLCGWSLILMPIALWFFGLAVRRSKVDGTLGLY